MLWPRQEVLQLVIPQLATHGKQLTPEVVHNVVKSLVRNQSPEGLISFDRWLIIAKDVLKWNDHIIRLFWDILLMATWYSNVAQEGLANASTQNNATEIDMYYIAIFLTLHVDDTPVVPTSPRVAVTYDTFWPSNYVDRDESLPSQATPHRPSTPSKNLTAPPSSSAPLSPRSPKSTERSPTPTSPKHLSANSSAGGAIHSCLSVAHGTPHQSRSPAQHLYALKQKIPLLLKVISTDELFASSQSTDSSPLHHSTSDSNDDNRLQSNRESAQEFIITKTAVDCLGLVLGNGTSRSAEAMKMLSAICPLNETYSGDKCEEPDNSSTTSKDSLCYSELIEWIEDNLVMNDTLHPLAPPSAHPKLSLVTVAGESLVTGADGRFLMSPRTLTNSQLSPRGGLSNFDDSSISPRPGMTERQAQPQLPLQFRSHISAIHPSLPTTIRNFSSTLILLTETDANPVAQTDANNLLPSSLANCVITGCVGAHLYLLSPFSTATLSNCIDCEILIGATAGAVVMQACERVSITTACRKLILTSCVECRLNIATLTPNIISGDSRGLIFGPYNTSYSSLAEHLSVSRLDALSPMHIKSFHSIDLSNEIRLRAPSELDSLNCWSLLHDITTCLDTPASVGSPSGYALDAAGTAGSINSLPAPPVSVATYLSCEKFAPLFVPCESQHQDLSECPIALPPLYCRCLGERSVRLAAMRERLIRYHSELADAYGPGAGLGNGPTGFSAGGPPGGVRAPFSPIPNGSSHGPSSCKLAPATSANTTDMMQQLRLDGEETVRAPVDSADGLDNFGGVVGDNGMMATEIIDTNIGVAEGLEHSFPQKFNKAFMDWMAATGRSQQLIDLVRLDAAAPTLNLSAVPVRRTLPEGSLFTNTYSGDSAEK